MQALIGVVVVAIAAGLSYRQAAEQAHQATRTEVLDLARAIAATEDVRDGLSSPDPAAELAPMAERMRMQTSTDFVVVMSTSGTRYSHPNPELIGQRFAGTIEPAVRGEVVVEDYSGSLGPSTRAVVPIRDGNQVIGLVSVGIRQARIEAALRGLLPDTIVLVIATGLLSGIGAFLVARRVRRQTLGLNAIELRRMHDHHEAVLHAVQEGLVIVDQAGRLQVINDEAARLLGLRADDVGRPLAELGLSESLARTLAGGSRRSDEQYVSGGRILLVSTDAVSGSGRQTATLTTLRDRTELEELTGALTLAKGMADALHAQTHEAANRLHTVIALIELERPEDALRFATDQLRTSQRLTEDMVAAIEEPAVAALLLGKVARAAECGVDLRIDPDAHLPSGVVPPTDAVTILGNLVDNAIDALSSAQVAQREIVVDVAIDDSAATLTVADTGPGLSCDQARSAFERGWSTKPTSQPAGRGLGLALVKQTVERLNGRIDVSEPPGAVFTVRLPVSAQSRTERPVTVAAR